jgi:ABC-type sugar transport system ATPase subunit
VTVTLKKEGMGMRKNIMVAFDDSGHMSVYKNRIFGFKRRSFSRQGIDQRVREAAEIPRIRVRKKKGIVTFLRGRPN